MGLSQDQQNLLMIGGVALVPIALYFALRKVEPPIDPTEVIPEETGVTFEAA